MVVIISMVTSPCPPELDNLSNWWASDFFQQGGQFIQAIANNPEVS